MCFINSIQTPRSRFRPSPGPFPPAPASPAGCRPRIQRGWTGRDYSREGNFLAVLSVGAA